MSNIKNQLIKLGSESPNLRKHIRPILDRISSRRDSYSDVRIREIEEKANKLYSRAEKKFREGHPVLDELMSIGLKMDGYLDGHLDESEIRPPDEAERRLDELERDVNEGPKSEDEMAGTGTDWRRPDRWR